MKTGDIRPCERKCLGPCGEWKHHSRFRTWRRESRGRVSTKSPTIRFSPVCKDCEQKRRHLDVLAERAEPNSGSYSTVAPSLCQRAMAAARLATLPPHRPGSASIEALTQPKAAELLNVTLAEARSS